MARKWLSVLLIMCLVVGVMMPAALADDSNETFIVVTNEDPKSFNPDAQADDYNVLMGIYLILALSVAAMMIVVDLVYAWLDPRIRYT